jgi:hypothetical protein
MMKTMQAIKKMILPMVVKRSPLDMPDARKKTAHMIKRSQPAM